MKQFKKTVSVILVASMLMTLGACQDKSADEVLDLAEDIANYTCDMDYKKLSKLTEDGDEKLEERFESIEEDDFKKAIANTLRFEFDDAGLEKEGKNGYTVEVTFTYVDYEEAMDGAEIADLGDWEDALDDCDEEIEETITLEFEKDGSDILFVNIDDLEDLFKYYDEDIAGSVIVDITDDEPVATTTTEPSETDPTPTPTPAPTSTPAPAPSDWDDPNYPDPNDYNVEGECYLLPGTNYLYTIADDGALVGDPYIGEGYFMLTGIWDYDMDETFAIMDGSDISCTSEDALNYRDSFSETSAVFVQDYRSHELSHIDLDFAGDTYECALVTVDNGTDQPVYVMVAVIGNEDCYYIILVSSRDMNRITSFANNFSRV